jgi:hypothetical protein
VRQIRVTTFVTTVLSLASTGGIDSLGVPERVDEALPREIGLAKMVVEIELPSSVSIRMPVPVTLRVRNTGTGPAELALTGRPIAFDIVVERTDGTEVWSRLHGETVSMMLQVTILQPGESLEFKHSWDQRDNDRQAVPAGTYAVRGAVFTPDRKLESEGRRLVISE